MRGNVQPHLLGISRRRKVVPSSFNQKMGRRRIKGDRKRVNGFLHLHDDIQVLLCHLYFSAKLTRALLMALLDFVWWSASPGIHWLALSKAWNVALWFAIKVSVNTVKNVPRFLGWKNTDTQFCRFGVIKYRKILCEKRPHKTVFLKITIFGIFSILKF